MLLRFEVSNHRSIAEPVELSMIAVDRDRAATRRVERLDEQVLTVAGIYGPNASGKSNLLEALAWLSQAVRRSLRGWDDGIPRFACKFGKWPNSMSTYEVDLVVRGVRHTYRLEVTSTEILFEGLYSYPERRRRTLFERDGMNLHFRRGLRGLTGIRELLTPTTLTLSAATRLDEAELRPVGLAIGNTQAQGIRRRTRASRVEGTLRMLEAETPDDHRIPSEPIADVPFESRISKLALLRFADRGIDDVLIESIQAGQNDEQRIRFVHRSLNEQVEFRFAEESDGTRNWFGLLGPVIHSLQSGHSLLFDELDSSLHPRLSARLIELFQDPVTNPHGAQLIFTSHDTSLLNHLNRDEVWLTEKGSDGATTLTALAEYGGDAVRRSTNLERAYLQGRFGALPDLDQATVRRVLGLGLATAGSNG